MISVVGTTGLGRVAGVPVGRPAALLRVVADRPDQHVIVLAPQHAASAARVQADLVSAARPSARVEVVVSRHHALTLALVAERTLRAVEGTGTADLTTLLESELTSARSLLWCPSVWRLLGVGVALGPRLRSVTGGPGFFVELGDRPRFDHGHDGWRPRSEDRLYGTGVLPELMITQLGEPPDRVDIEIESGAPYAPPSARLLTALAPETPVDAVDSVDTVDTVDTDAIIDNPQESEAA
ncbi:MAG TPA: hypothetical protein VIT65_13760 [Microlunatus sp.]